MSLILPDQPFLYFHDIYLAAALSSSASVPCDAQVDASRLAE